MTMLPPVLMDRQVLRIELGALGVVHLLFASVIAFAAEDKIVTPGSLPVFAVLPDALSVHDMRVVWAAGYTIGAVGFFILSAINWRLWMILGALLPAAFTGFIFWGIFTLAAFQGQGNPLGAVAFLVPLAWAIFTALRVVQRSGE